MKIIKKTILLTLCTIGVLTISSYKQMKKEELFPKLSTYCDKLSEEFIQIPEERKAELKDIANFIVEQRK